jgi:hypothetical protein
MKFSTLVCLVFFSLRTTGQNSPQQGNLPLTNFTPRSISIPLSPIVLENGKYFYDGRRVYFEDIVLPLVSINDHIVDRQLKVVRTMTDMIRPLRYLSFIYLIYLANHLLYTQGGYNIYLNNIIGVFIFQELYLASISIPKRKAIKRYNEVVVHPSAAIMPGSGFSVGITARF